MEKNKFGANMYHDPLKHMAVWLDDCEMDFNPSPMCNYQGDSMVDAKGTRYVAIVDLVNVDRLGQRVMRQRTNIKEKKSLAIIIPSSKIWKSWPKYYWEEQHVKCMST